MLDDKYNNIIEIRRNNDLNTQIEIMDNYQLGTNNYLINEDENYKILLLYILRRLDTDSTRKIYDLLMTYEVIELMQNNWIESIMSDNDNAYLENDYLDYPDID